MTGPQRYFSFIQWMILGLLMLCSIFLSRWVALTAFSLFAAWKIYAWILLPARLHKQLAGGRLKNQLFRDILKHSPFGVNPNKTQLFELAPQWPTIVLFSKDSSQLFVARELLDKLSQSELKIVVQWCYLLYEEGLVQVGYQIYSLFYPWFGACRWLDRQVLGAALQKWVSLERLLLGVMNVMYYPVYLEHQKVLARLCEVHSPQTVQALRQKIYYIVHCHEKKPPAELSFMLLDPEITDYDFSESIFGLLPTPELVMKGNKYGSPSTT